MGECCVDALESVIMCFLKQGEGSEGRRSGGTDADGVARGLRGMLRAAGG